MMGFTTRSLVRRMVDCHDDEAPRIANYYLRRAIDRGCIEQIALWRSVAEACEEKYHSAGRKERSNKGRADPNGDAEAHQQRKNFYPKRLQPLT